MSAPTATTVNTDSPSNSIVQASAGQRVQAGSLNIPASQAVSINSALTHNLLIVPASSNPAFGSFFTIDIREKNVILENITLQFTTSAVSGTTSLTGYFSPAFFWWQRIEVVQGGNVIDTLQNNFNFLENQLMEWDEDRLAINNMCGNYSSTAQRTLTSSQTTTNTVYCNLKSYINQINAPILTSGHEIQLRIYMDSLANVFTVSSGTLTSCTINSCNAICRITRLDMNSAQQRLNEMALKPHHYVMHDLHYGTFNVASGNTTATIILAPIVGNCSAIYFTVRASTVGANAWVYTPLASWALLDAGGTNIVGGQNLPASLCANIINRHVCKSSYNTETAFGTNNQSGNFFSWAFSADSLSAHQHGQALSSRRMTGQEQLVLVFPSALGSQVQVDVYAKTENILEFTTQGVIKKSL